MRLRARFTNFGTEVRRAGERHGCTLGGVMANRNHERTRLMVLNDIHTNVAQAIPDSTLALTLDFQRILASRNKVLRRMRQTRHRRSDQRRMSPVLPGLNGEFREFSEKPGRRV